MSLVVPELTTCIHQDTSHLQLVSLALHPQCEFKFARYCNENGIPYFLPLKQEIRLKPFLPQRCAAFLPRTPEDVNSRATTLLIRSDCIAQIYLPPSLSDEVRWRQEVAFLTHHHSSYRQLRQLPPHLQQNPVDPTVSVFEVHSHPAQRLQVYFPREALFEDDAFNRYLPSRHSLRHDSVQQMLSFRPTNSDDGRIYQKGHFPVEAAITFLGIHVVQPFPLDNLILIRDGQQNYGQ